MFVHGRLILTASGILLDEVKSLLQKALRRKECDLVIKATKELIGRGKDQLPWKCILTYMFEDHCLNGDKILSALIERYRKADKYGSIELILRYCGTCRIAACLPVIALDREYDPTDWCVDIVVEEDLKDLVCNSSSRINCCLLFQHLKTAWLDKNKKHLITYTKLITMVNDHDKVTVTRKGLKYCYYTELKKKANVIMVALTLLSKVSKEQADVEMANYCQHCCFLATIKEAPLRLIMSAAVMHYIHRDTVRHYSNLKVGEIKWSQVRKIDSLPDWAVDKHTFRGKTGRSTKPYLNGKSEAKHLSDAELEEFHGQRPKRDIEYFLQEGVRCKDEVLLMNPYWEKCKEIYLEKPKKLQKTIKMTAVYYNEILNHYSTLKGKTATMTREVISTKNQKRKRDLDVDDDSEESGVEKMVIKKAKIIQVPDGGSKYDIKELISSDLPCLDGPLLQIPTSSGKVYTRLDLKKGCVWKGPYSDKRISLALFFHRVLKEVFCCPHTLAVKRHGQHLQFPLLCDSTMDVKVSVKDFNDCIARREVKNGRFVLRESLGIVQLHKVGEHHFSKVPSSLWCHYLFRYAMNIGDSGLYNCLTDNKLSFLYGIDMEECRMAVHDDKLLTLMFTKRPRIGLQNAILKSVQGCCQDMLRTMSQEFDTQQIRTLATFYKVGFNETKFCDRIRKAIDTVKTHIPLAY